MHSKLLMNIISENWILFILLTNYLNNFRINRKCIWSLNISFNPKPINVKSNIKANN